MPAEKNFYPPNQNRGLGYNTRMSRLFSNRKKFIIASSILVIFLAALITAVSSNTNKQDSSNKNFVVSTVSPTQKQDVAGAETTPTISPASNQPTPTIKTSHQIATVVKVVDGDTIAVSLNGKTETIRIIGINTPETVDPRKTVECFGKEASNKAKEYFKEKDYNVWLEEDPTQGERDKYQRLLRYVFAGEGVSDYGLMMI